jgi:hypothetical protein
VTRRRDRLDAAVNSGAPRACGAGVGEPGFRQSDPRG